MISMSSDAKSASETESSRKPLVDDISADEVEPIRAQPGNASRTVATSDGSKLSNAATRNPACGASPSSWSRHWSTAIAIASAASTSSLCPTAILSMVRLRADHNGASGS